MLDVRNVVKEFKVRNKSFRAVNDVSFSIKRGETLGLVGESGCGKSTLARTVIGLYRPNAGEVRLKGRPFVGVKNSPLRMHRRDIQMVFQDPYASLDPRMKVRQIIAEPLLINGDAYKDRVLELMDLVGLSASMLDRYPSEFSGGQRQRIGIARALALEPDLLILDEAVSALDVSIQAQVINLLKRLQRELHLSYLFVSHDLSVVRHISDRVAVMYLGKIIEIGTRDEIFESPSHPYTKSLLGSIPTPHPLGREQRERIVLKGDLPNPNNPPSGCVFRTRCPIATSYCAEVIPELKRRTSDGRLTACHYASDL